MSGKAEDYKYFVNKFEKQYKKEIESILADKELRNKEFWMKKAERTRDRLINRLNRLFIINEED